MPPPLRLALPSDIPSIVPLLNAAYGPRPTFEERFRAYLSLEPSGWLVAEEGSSLLGVGGFVAFGRCAYIGLMAVAPSAQRRGLGAAIFDSLVARCDARGLELLLLDASPSGAPLYEKRAFRDHGLAHLYSLDPRVVGRVVEDTPALRIHPLAPGDTAAEDEVARLDAHGYGADRSAFIRHTLRESSGRVFVARDASGALVGYSVGKRSSFGPCMARSSDVARALVHRTLTLACDDRVTWLVGDQNPEAMTLAQSLGEHSPGRWRHMRKGNDAALASDWTTVFAKASLAVG